MLALHLRHSSVMDTLVYTDIVLGENRGATTGWADTCSLTQNANGYQCPVRGSDLRWYYCGNADLCKMGRFDCPVSSQRAVSAQCGLMTSACEVLTGSAGRAGVPQGHVEHE
eukprot:3603149-Rhodomonas_salina.1